jgi:catechol 2,3-dioxygenase-like lactoylglutathione lyase family enzyme
VQARDLPEARRFYEALLGAPGRHVAPGRVYFDVGPVILGVLDYSRAPASERSPPTESVYIATDELDRVYARARRLGGLSNEDLHDDPSQPMGKIVVRPWGERSFYLNDPSGNPLCFVDAATVFSGTPEQIAALTAGRSR